MGNQSASHNDLQPANGLLGAYTPQHLPALFDSRTFCPVSDNKIGEAVEVSIDSRSVSIRSLTSDAPASLVIPMQHFEGVVVHIEGADTPGEVIARLILKHADPQLSILLSETDRPELLAQSWPEWANALNLPMLVWDPGGAIKPIEAYSAQPYRAPSPRRKLPLLTGRRPRFLVKRKMGTQVTHCTVHAGEREIIAPK